MGVAKHTKRKVSVKEKVAHRGLVLTPPDYDHWTLGAASERFGSDDINPTGDWTPYKAADEAQNTYFETMGCAVFGTTKAYITLAKFHDFNDFPMDVSERYTGIEAGTNEYGTDVQVVAETIRSSAGLVPEAELPWTPDLTTLATFYAPKPMDVSIFTLGNALLARFVFGHEWIFAQGNSYTPAQKADELKAALKRGTVCVSVLGWQQDGKGLYTKKKGAGDNHWVQLLRYDGDNPVIHDSYPPFEKTLAANYDFNVAKVYFLKRNDAPAKTTFWSQIWDAFSRLAARLNPPSTTPPDALKLPQDATSTPSAPFPVPATVPESETLDWATQKGAYHAARVVCDRVGLSLAKTIPVSLDGKLIGYFAPKDILCACLWQESQFRNTAICRNVDAKGQLWSSDWGICQVNDYWHIGPGKDFPSVRYVLDHPEKVVAWMAGIMDATGKLSAWASYASGAFKQHLLPTSPMWALGK